MTERNYDGDRMLVALPAGGNRWRRWGLATGLTVLGGLLLLALLWNAFFHYVPPGHMLVIVSKNGGPLKEGQVLADEGEKGPQRKVLGEGWHFVTPILYTTQLAPNFVVEPGKVGIVTAQGGVPPRDGRVLAVQDDEKGIRRQVLLPGAYRLNPIGYKVEQVPVTEIKPGFVGVKRRLLGADGETQFATKPTEKGILKDEVLQPGLYFVNTAEYQIIPREVGVYQKTFHYDADRAKNTAITFPAQDGNVISLDCTIEWEVLPASWPALVAKNGTLANIEQNVIVPAVERICRNRGSNYGAQDFLEGDKRERFQKDFQDELDKACKADDVVIRSAFIRNIVIPDTFLEQKRLQQLSVETRLTSEELTKTATTEAEVAEAESMVAQRQKEVGAETARMVAVIEQDTENIKKQTEADIERMRNEYGAKIAQLDSERDRVLGEAKAEVTKMKDTAQSSLYKMQMDLFGRDGDAFLRYTMAQQMNPKLVLRLFHSGPGTLWTNLGDKNMTLMMPLPGADKPKAAAEKGK
jgi:hypothetical protein